MSRKYQESYSATYWIVGFITVGIFGLIIFLVVKINPQLLSASLSSKSSREVALTCTTDMATKFHIHPNLKITVKGQNVELPANIGIEPNCMMSLHTHDASGQIHVEAPEKKDFTLGDFFAVWQKDMELFGQNMKMTVSGQDSTDYESYIMKDHDQIELIFE